MSYKALLFCAEETSARVIAQALNDLGFLGEPCSEPSAAVKKLTSGRLDAMVIDCSNEQDVALLVKSARHSSFNQQALFVAVVEDKSGVTNAFRLGANLVLTKPVGLEQARSTLRVARGLLHQNEAAKSAVPTAQSISRPEAATASSAAPVALKLPAVPSAPWAPASSVSAPPASILEVEEDPSPSLEPAEAGVLESVQDMPGEKPAPSARPAIAAKEEHPWQGAAEPAKPVASSLLGTEKAAGETETKGMSTAPSSLPASPIGEALPTGAAAVQLPGAGTGVGQGAAAAPARAPEPETSGSSEKSASISGQSAAPAAIAKPEEQRFESSNKKWLAVAAVVVAVVAAGYVGWTKLHPFTSGAAALMHLNSAPSVPAVPPVTRPPALEPTPAKSADTNLSQPPASQTKAQPAVGMPAPRQTLPTPKSMSDSPTSLPSASAPQEVLVVGSQPAATTSLPKPSEDQPVPSAPTMMEVTPNPADQAISSIVTNSSASVPTPTLEDTRVSQGVAQGLLIKRVQPVYPLQALSMHLQGAVELLAIISKDGSVTKLKQLRGDPVLGRAAMDAVKQWKYRPYLLDGEPVEIQTQITVNFKAP